MIFELSTALRFLSPNRRELARSLIALLSFVVIATISWLVVVFYSVTEGLEKRWIDQLVHFTGNIRLLPTPQYFQSYEFLIDDYSEASSYSPQSLFYHRTHPQDPWNDQTDAPLPSFLLAQRPTSGKYPSHELFKQLEKTPFCHAASAHVSVEVELDRWTPSPFGLLPEHQIGKLQQNAQLIGFNPWTAQLSQLVLAHSEQDLRSLWLSLEQLQEPVASHLLEPILEQTGPSNWAWRSKLAILEQSAPLSDYKLTLEGPSADAKRTSVDVYAATQEALEQLSSEIDHLTPWIFNALSSRSTPCCFLYTPLWAFENVAKAKAPEGSLNHHLLVTLQAMGSCQKVAIEVPLSYLVPQGPTDPSRALEPLALLFQEKGNSSQGYASVGLLAPKILKDMGLHAGARLLLSKELMGPLGSFTLHYQAIVVGFYDPGIFPLGGRFLIAPWDCVSHFFQPQEQDPYGDFVQIWSEQPKLEARALQERLEQTSLSELFTVESYDEFNFSRDLILQLQSDRRLLSLIAIIILMVACSSIASMLVLLVNERRREIALLQALGLSKWRMVACFTLSGSLMGLISAMIGIGLAFLTLQNIDGLMALLSYLNGEPLLNPLFYGYHLPQTMSPFAVKLVAIGSWGLSTLSGCVASAHSAKESPANLMRTL